MVGGDPGPARSPGPDRYAPAKSLTVSGASNLARVGFVPSTWHWVQLVRCGWLTFVAILSPTLIPGPWQAIQLATVIPSVGCGMVGGAVSNARFFARSARAASFISS